ncbi:hypothetical protein HHK36_032986 [Tetracentron sinense]|uniref:Late embryogenesis abundant protein LEA-2 subgroup domain-containing protein n=1 Tax=Tetracentron sinense TaxID=13715 RepID=A0A835CX25_TETSI|nr:hypothetical protein HHK36_032986 [Tetracentron sinense]
MAGDQRPEGRRERDVGEQAAARHGLFFPAARHGLQLCFDEDAVNLRSNYFRPGENDADSSQMEIVGKEKTTILGKDKATILGKDKTTSILVWGGAIICTIIAIAVIITGLVVFVGYIIIRPRVPFMRVTYAHLDNLHFDQTGLLDTQIALIIKAENDNARAHASFSDISFLLIFHGLRIAQLRADPFDVPKNNSFDLSYVIPSLSIPLEPYAMEEVDASLKQNKISFELKGNARTRWKVGVIGSIKNSSVGKNQNLPSAAIALELENPSKNSTNLAINPPICIRIGKKKNKSKSNITDEL